MNYCSRCVYPNIAVNLNMDDDGVCSACRTFEQFQALSPEFWAMRKQKFERILDEVRGSGTGGYD
jgi:hypothetical protein